MLKIKTLGIISLTLIFVIVPFLSAFNLFQKSNALGGGFVPGNSTTTTVNSTTATVTSPASKNIKGVYLVVEASSFDPSITVSSVSDTRSTTFAPSIQSHVFEDAEIWFGNYTNTNFLADTITVTFSGSTESLIAVYTLTDARLNNSVSSTGDSGHGTGATLSVTSLGQFPPSLYACLNFGVVDSGSTTLGIFTSTNFFYQQASKQLATTVFQSISQFSNFWNGFGNSIVSTTVSPTVGTPQWDNAVTCFPEGPATSTTTSTINVGIGTDELSIYGLLALCIGGFAIFAFRRRLR